MRCIGFFIYVIKSKPLAVNPNETKNPTPKIMASASFKLFDHSVQVNIRSTPTGANTIKKKNTNIGFPKIFFTYSLPLTNDFIIQLCIFQLATDNHIVISQ